MSRTSRSPSEGAARSSRARRTARWEGSREGLGSSASERTRERGELARRRQERRKAWLDAERSGGIETTVTEGLECRERVDRA